MNDRTTCPVHDRCQFAIAGKACGYENSRSGNPGWRVCPHAKRLGAGAAAGLDSPSGDGSGAAPETVSEPAAVDAGGAGRDAGVALAQGRLI